MSVTINNYLKLQGVWESEGKLWVLDSANTHYPDCVIMTDNIVEDSDPQIGYYYYYREVIIDRVSLLYEANQLTINAWKMF